MGLRAGRLWIILCREEKYVLPKPEAPAQTPRLGIIHNKISAFACPSLAYEFQYVAGVADGEVLLGMRAGTH